MILFAIQMLLVGTGVGLLSGALGLGGGILMVPAFLAFVPHMDPHTAKGTSLFIIIFVALMNAWRLNRRLPSIPWETAAYLAAGSVAGSYLGAWITSIMPEDVVLWIFILLLAVLAVHTFFVREPDVDDRGVRRRRTLNVLIGLVAGIVGGATGTGGGVALIPLALAAGIASNNRVAGLSNLVMVATSAAGSIAHFQAQAVYPNAWTVGHVYFGIVPLVFLGAQIGSPLGRRANAYLTLPRRRLAMGIMLLLISVQLIYKLHQ